jgi:hypothetical protein
LGEGAELAAGEEAAAGGEEVEGMRVVREESMRWVPFGPGDGEDVECRREIK